jgi:antitoxin MazE
LRIARIAHRLIPSAYGYTTSKIYLYMQVSKWGNSLAVRLPAMVVEALDLKEGDEIEISIAGKRDFKVARDRSKERALEQLRQMKWSFPPDFKFNREEINER